MLRALTVTCAARRVTLHLPWVDGRWRAEGVAETASHG